MRRVVCVLVALVAALGLTAAPGGAATEPGPPLSVPQASLAAAGRCDAGAAAGRRTVLLVPGTGATADEAWSWNYARALPAAGYGVCTVNPPGRSLGDFGTSVQYAVYAARYAYRLSGHKIAILGHSQGGLMAVWITKFWPDIGEHATDVIGLAANVRGTALANTLCTGGACAPIAWQMRMGSHLTDAATRAPLPRTTSVTSIGTREDEVVYPQPEVSSFNGVRTTLLQDVCPTHVNEHGGLLFDPVAYALVMDALTHPGPARVSRIDPGVCLQTTMPDVDPVGASQFAKTVVALSVGLLDAGTYTTAEAPVPSYAKPYAG